MGKSSKKTFMVYDAFDLIQFAWEKKFLLIGITFLGAVLSIIISLTLTDKFKSTVVLFPAASVSLSKSLVETTSIQMDNRDVLSFGREEDAERMLQILYSNQIKDYVVQKYGLMNHYEIDLETDKFPYTKLDNKYKSNIKFRRTQFQSIEISVLDEDPQYAADIANDIAAYIDSTIHNMQKERAQEAFNIVEHEFNSAQTEIESLNDTIQKIRMLGIIDYESQAASLNEAYAQAIARNNTQVANKIKNRMNNLAKYGGIYVELSKKLEAEIERYGQLKAKFASAKINVEQTVPQIFIVDEAKKSERKSEPKRSIIVLVSTISTFAIALLLLLIVENVRVRMRQQ